MVLSEITGSKCTYTIKMPVPQLQPSTKPEREKEQEEQEEGGHFLKISDDDAPEETQPLKREELPVQLASAYANYSHRGHPPFTNFKVDFQVS